MPAAQLTIVARNATAVLREDCAWRKGRPWFDYYELNLSDKHMNHVCRFHGLGQFDRQQWQRMRAYCAWKRAVYGANNALAAQKLTDEARGP